VNGVEGAVSQVPPVLAGATRTAAEAAFVHGFVEVMLVCGAVAAIGSIIAYALIRRRDLHASALGPDPAVAEAPAAGAPELTAEGDAARSAAS